MDEVVKLRYKETKIKRVSFVVEKLNDLIACSHVGYMRVRHMGL